MNAIQTLGDAVSKLGKQINDLQREVAGRKSHAHRLSLELKQSDVERERLSGVIDSQKFRIDQLNDSFREVVDQREQLKLGIERLEASNSALSADCNARQAREQEMGTVIVALQAELKSLNDEIKALQFTVEKRNEAIDYAVRFIEGCTPNGLDITSLSGQSIAIQVDSLLGLLNLLKLGAQK